MLNHMEYNTMSV